MDNHEHKTVPAQSRVRKALCPGVKAFWIQGWAGGGSCYIAYHIISIVASLLLGEIDKAEVVRVICDFSISRSRASVFVIVRVLLVGLQLVTTWRPLGDHLATSLGNARDLFLRNM